MRAVALLAFLVLVGYASLAARDLLTSPNTNPQPAIHLRLPPMPAGMGFVETPKPMLLN